VHCRVNPKWPDAMVSVDVDAAKPRQWNIFHYFLFDKWWCVAICAHLLRPLCPCLIWRKRYWSGEWRHWGLSFHAFLANFQDYVRPPDIMSWYRFRCVQIQHTYHSLHRGKASDPWLREPRFESCAAVLKNLGQVFVILHCSRSLSCMNEYLATDSGGWAAFAHYL